MKSLLLVFLLAVLSVSNDAAGIRGLQNQNKFIIDSDVDIPAPIDLVLREDEVLNIFDGEQKSLGQDVSASRSQGDLDVGFIGPQDRALFRVTIFRAGIENSVRILTMTYTTENNETINAVMAWEQGISQNARAAITGGGVGRNTVTITLTSDVGRGFNYAVAIFGR